MNIAGFDKLTYDQVRTIDNHWNLGSESKRDVDGITMGSGYAVNNARYKGDQHGLMFFDTNKPKLTRSLIYMFTDPETWKKYQRQMQVMEAIIFDTT